MNLKPSEEIMIMLLRSCEARDQQIADLQRQLAETQTALKDVQALLPTQKANGVDKHV